MSRPGFTGRGLGGGRLPGRETGCRNLFFTCGFDGTSFHPDLAEGPAPRAGEDWPAFRDRLAAFHVAEVCRRRSVSSTASSGI